MQNPTANGKLDLRKQYKKYYSPSAKAFEMIEIPSLQYLMIDGHGDPNTSPLYQDAIQTLYSLSYTLKFNLKAQGNDYTVMGLEGLWWMPDMSAFSLERKSDWDWTAMILQPDFITPAHVDQAKTQALSRGKAPLAENTRLETFSEGLCAQILYFGPYANEGPAIARMHEYIKENGYILSGKHHEIYLSDVRKVAPEKNRTILRQPVKLA